jgi:DNA polymerase III alpha subunit (gram-positive type)
MRILIFDTETGGLDPKAHSVFSVGALVGDLESGEIISKFEALNKLESIDSYKFTPKAIEIHGITPTQAFNEGEPTEVIRDKFMDLWHEHGAQILGGHNAAFDVRMMAHQVYKIEPQQFEANFTYRIVDSMPIIRLFAGNENIKSGASLSATAKALNIDLSDLGKGKFHAALYDSIVCFRILHKFRKVLTLPDVIERLTK